MARSRPRERHLEPQHWAVQPASRDAAEAALLCPQLATLRSVLPEQHSEPQHWAAQPACRDAAAEFERLCPEVVTQHSEPQHWAVCRARRVGPEAQRRHRKVVAWRRPAAVRSGRAHSSAVAGPAERSFQARPFQAVPVAPAAPLVHSALPVALVRQAARAAVAAVPASLARPLVAAEAARRAGLADEAVARQAVQASPAGPQQAAVPSAAPLVVPSADPSVPPLAALSAALWAFPRDRFRPAARLARRPRAHSHSVHARAGLRVAQP